MTSMSTLPATVCSTFSALPISIDRPDAVRPAPPDSEDPVRYFGIALVSSASEVIAW